MIISKSEHEKLINRIKTLEKANSLYRKQIDSLERENQMLICSLLPKDLDFPNSQERGTGHDIDINDLMNM